MGVRSRSLREARHVDKWSFVGDNKKFYELNYDAYIPDGELSEIATAAFESHSLPWKLKRRDVWTHVVPADGLPPIMPAQGWKIHVSANDRNCAELLREVAEILCRRNTFFKFANDLQTLIMMTSKRWSRGGSGKFITIYPKDDQEFKSCLEELYRQVGSYEGPYILSDKRYKDSRCLYYRYGGMAQITELDYMGIEQPLLISPDGSAIIDRRDPFFSVPAWTQDPFGDEDDDSDEMTLDQGRYLVESSLGFSNTGGVYLATDTATGRKVVIKEARPHVELYSAGKDATHRLLREMHTLEALSATGICPAPLASFSDWENSYLVEEHIDASDMREVMLKMSPLVKVEPSAEDSKTFYGQYIKIFNDLLLKVDKIHKQGYILGDLSPPNILLEKQSLNVRIIDLEGAVKLGEESDDIHTIGFRSNKPRDSILSTVEDDLYAVAAIMMYSMFPIVALAFLRDDIFDKVLPIMVRDIGWDSTPVQDVIQGLHRGSITLVEAAEMLRQPAEPAKPMANPDADFIELDTNIEGLTRFLVNNVRDEFDQSIFYSDPFSRYTNSIGFGFGDSGVLYALNQVGCSISAALSDRYEKALGGIDESKIPPGIVTGFSGIAVTALARKKFEDARRFLDLANSSRLLSSHHSLYYGMAGIGMANLAVYLETGDKSYLEHAKTLGRQLAETMVESTEGSHWRDDGGVRIGFGYGQSGCALFLLRLSQITEDSVWREIGERCLKYDLSFGHQLEEGVTTFPSAPEEKNTFEPYIEQGAAGIAKVAIRFGHWENVETILKDAHRKYCGFSGSLYGLAGLLDVFIDAYLYSGDSKYIEMARRPYEGLKDIFIFKDGEGAAVPGDSMFRISCDYATGVAGVLRALHRVKTLSPDDLCLDVVDNLPKRSRQACESH